MELEISLSALISLGDSPSQPTHLVNISKCGFPTRPSAVVNFNFVSLDYLLHSIYVDKDGGNNRQLRRQLEEQQNMLFRLLDHCHNSLSQANRVETDQNSLEQDAYPGRADMIMKHSCNLPEPLTYCSKLFFRLIIGHHMDLLLSKSLQRFLVGFHSYLQMIGVNLMSGMATSQCEVFDLIGRQFESAIECDVRDHSMDMLLWL
ncbi:hypothetical protein BDV28DRAFT_41185 [Aspergillus coremiiformis]|uniref:Uncharacterized protein n=1 Tax=Aspergillus coremiiformis TaxID=138285 RepID=A0A5N6ZGL9_9EURO|nr:hypothetical protein BDV28DRAFT_41185 [Aspergillus coremiiformis]